MLRCFARRLYSSSHSRDITAFFHKNSVKYSIPIYFDEERKLFGNVLELEFDLSALSTKRFVLKKDVRICGEGDPPPLYYKSFLTPEVKVLS